MPLVTALQNIDGGEFEGLKWYHDQKITFIFSSDFKTIFTKHPPSIILSLNFEKKTVYLKCNFLI